VSGVMIFSGNATPVLAKQVAEKLEAPLGNIEVCRFSDGETRVEIKENIRGRDIFIVQSTCAPANDTLMELAIMADAFRRASAASITAVMPYFGYARQDRRVRSTRVPITARIVADMLQSVGVGRVITVDLHADQIQGFFSIPVDNIYASRALLETGGAQQFKNVTVVSPDVGGVVRARAIAKQLNVQDLAIIDKRRQRANHAEVMNIIGDVSERNCILVDDIVDTAGTLCAAANALKDAGARSVVAYCTHPVLSGKAVENIENSSIDEIVVGDSIPLSAAAHACLKIKQVSLSGIIAETILRITNHDSVSSLFS
jgi:ribose-phosphate pyrophosphokinase